MSEQREVVKREVVECLFRWCGTKIQARKGEWFDLPTKYFNFKVKEITTFINCVELVGDEGVRHLFREASILYELQQPIKQEEVGES